MHRHTASWFVPEWIAALGHEAISRGLSDGTLRTYGDMIVPAVAGAENDDPPETPNIFEGSPFADFAAIPVLATLDDAQLTELITDLETAVSEVLAGPLEFVSKDYTAKDLIAATQAAQAKVRELKAAAADRVKPELTADEQAAFADLATPPAEPAAEAPAAEVAPEPEVTPEPEPVTAALPRPTGDHALIERPAARPSGRVVPLVAAAGARDIDPGTPFQSELDLAEAMVRRQRSFGSAGPDVAEKFTIARASWRDDYATERTLTKDEETNWDLVNSVIDPSRIKAELRDRIAQVDALVASGKLSDAELNLVASGGLCAPVTPYYNLQFISVPVRPVMGSLPSFLADRGGLRYARPAALSAVTTAVGLITEAEDRAGGSQATKTCQVIPCPEFQETDVDIIYHCLQFGNLGARAFPELVAQWNNLVLAAHARLAETNLLTIIDSASTQVTAGHLGLGASASLFSQILAAANGLRNRNRMDPEAVLRIMLPWWSVDLIVSDVIRTQFQRFDTDRARVTALLRSFNIEPTFYIDGANGRSQVFGTQNAGALLPFPSTVVWYLFPEGSFLYLDGGILELGIVRDSILNQTNDFQIFGESFESVAYVGVESLAVASTVCDSGTVSLPTAVTCPVSYAGS